MAHASFKAVTILSVTMPGWCPLFKLTLLQDFSVEQFDRALIDVHQVTTSGSNVLHFTTLNPENPRVFWYILLKAEQLVSESNDFGELALHWAIKEGTSPMVQAMLTINPELVNFPDGCGNTPLHWAAEYNHTDMVGILLQRNADGNVKNHEGKTPFSVALENESRESASLLKNR